MEIIVKGNPAPQGSKSFKGMRKIRGKLVPILVESSKAVKPWRAEVEHYAILASDGIKLPLTGALRVAMIFSVEKPKAKREWPSVFPDLSKYVRATEDALTKAGIWEDDGRVVDCRAIKCYPKQLPRSCIHAGTMGPLDCPHCERMAVGHPLALTEPGARIIIMEIDEPIASVGDNLSLFELSL